MEEAEQVAEAEDARREVSAGASEIGGTCCIASLEGRAGADRGEGSDISSSGRANTTSHVSVCRAEHRASRFESEKEVKSPKKRRYVTVRTL